MRRLTRACAALGLVCLPWPAVAACQIDTRSVAFGVVDVTRQNDTTGEVALTCTIATEVEVALSSNAAPGMRYMAGPSGGRLVYDVYPDATHSVPWGDGTGTGTTRSIGTDGESTARLTIYGRVPQQNAVPPGSYNDSLSVLVTF